MPATVLDAPPAPVRADAAGTRRPTAPGDRPTVQFVCFVLVGGSANLVYAALFLLFGRFGDQSANVVAVLASTALANELHRRLTFRAGDRVGWATAQWAGGGIAAVGLAVSSLTLAAVEVWTDSAGPLVSIAAVVAVSGAVGLARFVGLRWVLVLRPGARP
ncbi:GtrA family protein [Geodermatophilus sp. SYSU D01106]